MLKEVLNLSDNLAEEWMQMDAEARQQAFFDVLPKSLTVWSVKGEQGWVMAIHDESECLPVWSHEILAKKWLAQHHPDATPQSISLSDFRQTWLPGLKNNNIGLLISSSDVDDDVVAMSADEFLDAL